MKRIIIVVLALILMAGCVVPAFKANGSVGSITLKGIEENITYKLYLLLDLESYNVSENAYAYKVNSAWNGFFETSGALDYVNVNDGGYVTWKDSIPESSAAAFANLALSYAEEHGITPIKSSDIEGQMAVNGTTGTFENLELGYYLIDSNLGSLCGLTTTNADAEVTVKNGRPTLETLVQEDSTMEWRQDNTADIRQIVHFCSTITAYNGAENYVLHEVMPDGITYDNVIKLEYKKINKRSDWVELDSKNYRIIPNESKSDGHTFDIAFTQNYCDTLETGDMIRVYYDGTLTENAVIAESGNISRAWLTYGDSFKTTETYTTTYSYAFDLIKTDNQKALLDGAEFKIYNSATNGTEVAVVQVSDSVYRRAADCETGVSITVKDGHVRLVGFDNDMYYLEEIKAPDGYNKLLARTGFEISEVNLDATIEQGVYLNGGVHIVNKTGSLLPQTGGSGTMVFVLAGALLVLGAGIVLVARKRFSDVAE